MMRRSFRVDFVRNGQYVRAYFGIGRDAAEYAILNKGTVTEEVEKEGPICPRCKRMVSPWPIRRADVCSAKGWARCIRQVEDVLADIQRREAKKLAKKGAF